MNVIGPVLTLLSFFCGKIDIPATSVPPKKHERTEEAHDPYVQSKLKIFLKTGLLLDPEACVIEPFKPSHPSEGTPSRKIFFIKDLQGKLICVVKLIPEDMDLGMEEWKALDQLHHVELKHHNPLALMGFGEFDTPSQHYTAIAMKPAEGLSLYNHFKNVTKAPKHSLERQKQLEYLMRAANLTGKAYSELHAYHRTPYVAREYITRNEELFNLSIENLSKDPQHAEKAEKFDEVSKEYKEKEPQAGWIHGDAHPGNVFINLKTGKVTLIDLSDMYDSIKEERYGGPIIEDYATLLYFMGHLGKELGLSKSEIRKVKKAFIKGYGKKEPFDPISIAYYQILLSTQMKEDGEETLIG